MFPKAPGAEEQENELATTCRRSVMTPRFLIYLQMGTLVPAIVIGRCEVWGYAFLMHYLGMILSPLALAILLSSAIFPVMAFLQLAKEPRREPWGWAAPPISLALSWLQVAALLPRVQ